VGPPSVPTITRPARDLPDHVPDPGLFGLEMKRREDFGFIPIPYTIDPKVDPLLYTPTASVPHQPLDFGTPVTNFAGQTSIASPPDTSGDVGPSHYVQAVNQSETTVRVYDKTGTVLKTFTMESLAISSPCSSGFCDPVVLYDRVADRWVITELPSSSGSVCVYVSAGPDPTGSWYAYTFGIAASLPDFPKYGVWPQGSGGSYLIGVNYGTSGNRDVVALDRGKMLAGLPATFQKFSVPGLPNSGFEMVLPSTMQGDTPPPNGEKAIFMRPRDDEAQDGLSNTTDKLELWGLTVDWATPANSQLSPLPSISIGDYDMTLCGLGGIWNCMPQPGTAQKIDPIREPLHFPLQYRNFGTHQTMVGTFPVDVDGTDHAAMRWFELRKTGAGPWVLFQEGLVGGEANVHRSVGSIAMDRVGNIAIGYTRTGTNAPYYPSIYYRGRLATDPLGTMPHGEFAIQDATTSKTNNERWGDYSTIAIDPADDCTFWHSTEYGGSGQTRIAAFRFDACTCAQAPDPPDATASVPQDNRIDIGWDDSSLASIVEYEIYRGTSPGGPYAQIAVVADTSPGTGSGPSYVHHDDAVSGGTHYYYVVKSTDGGGCTSLASNQVDAVATGVCNAAPPFAGLALASNPGASTCTLNLSWPAATGSCGGGVRYNVYRSTTSGFTPAPADRIATGLTGTSFSDGIALDSGASYHYVVRAVDVLNGLEDQNTVQRTGTPTGPPATASWTDTFEGAQSGGGFDLPGWARASLLGGTNWTWSTARAESGTHSWFAPEATSANDKVLVSPSFTVIPATTLTFFHTYAFETPQSSCYDGGTLEYSVNGTTWIVVPIGDFTAGAYNGTINSSSGNPLAGKRAWCGGTLGALTQVSVNLGGDPNIVNRTIKLRWHEGDDVSVGGSGWYVDTVTIANYQGAEACTPGSGALVMGSDAPICENGTLHLTASWSEPGVTYAWTGPDGFASGAQNPAVPNASSSASGSYAVTVYSGPAAIAANSIPVTVIANGAACDDADVCTGGDLCGAGTCAGAPAPPLGAATGLGFATAVDLGWSAVPSAPAYDVVRGSLSLLQGAGDFTASTEACVGNDHTDTTIQDAYVPPEGDGVWYLVRAASACGDGTFGDGSEAAPRDPGIAASANTCP
jgi:hypothetical protein